MSAVSADDIKGYGKYLLTQGEKPEDVKAYSKYLADHNNVKLEDDEEKPANISDPLITNKTTQDLVTGIGEHIPGIPQIGGAGNVINQAISGDIDPLDIDDLKKSYEQGRQKVVHSEAQATKDSPIANRVGQGTGLLVGGVAAPFENLIANGALMGGLSSASRGSPVIAGTDQQQKDALKETAIGTGVGGVLGYGGQQVGKGLAALGETPAGRAFLKSMKGVKLTGPTAINDASQTVNKGVEEASNSVEALRKKLGVQRDVIEGANQKMDLSGPIGEIKALIGDLPDSPRVASQKKELLDMFKGTTKDPSVEDAMEELANAHGLAPTPKPVDPVAAEGTLNALGKPIQSAPSDTAGVEDQLAILARKMGLNKKVKPAEIEMAKMANASGLAENDPAQDLAQMAQEHLTPPEETSAPLSTEEPLPQTDPEDAANIESDLQNRAGGTDKGINEKEIPLTDALALRSKLRTMSQDFTQPAEVRQVAKQAMAKLNESFEGNTDIRENDALYKAIKDSQSVLGKKYGESNRLMPTKAGNAIVKKSQDNSVTGGNASQAFNRAMDQLSKVSPDVAAKIRASLGDQVENLNLAKKAKPPELSWDALKDAPTWLGAKTGEVLSPTNTNPVVRTGHAIYSMGETGLRGVAEAVSSVPGGKNLGSALHKALDNKNDVMKNAALFSIMQNPTLRQALGSGDEK